MRTKIFGANPLSIIPILLLIVLNSGSNAAGQVLPANEVNALMARTIFKFDHKSIKHTRGITAGRYMEEGSCSPATFPNWSNPVGDEFPLKQCTYTQPDKSSPTHNKIAKVIMLNPSKEVLAKWIIATCLIVTGKTERNCVDRLAEEVIEASGSQFAVAGIVLEDQRPANPDGIQEAYTFRDGVTVKLKNGLTVGFTGMYSEADNARALDPASVVEATASNRGPARIQSTSRQEYTAYMGSQAKDVSGVNWLTVVRETYKDSWRRAHNPSLPEDAEKYRNDLMMAHCFALLGITPPPK